jgi:hypothetical protein
MAKGKYEYWLSSDGLLLLEAYARNGLTDDQIAHNLGITRSTLSSWKGKFSRLSEALRKGKEVVDIQVENSLLKRALGFDYQEVKVEDGVDSDGCPYSKVVKTTKKVVPDTTAQIFWLKNRKPKEWNGQSKVNISPDQTKSNQEPHQVVWDMLNKVSEKVATGELDPKRASVIVTSCNAILGSIRADEQQKQIEQLADLLEELLNDKEGTRYEKG